MNLRLYDDESVAVQLRRCFRINNKHAQTIFKFTRFIVDMDPTRSELSIYRAILRWFLLLVINETVVFSGVIEPPAMSDSERIVLRGAIKSDCRLIRKIKRAVRSMTPKDKN